MDPDLHISPTQEALSRGLLWLVALVIVSLMTYHYHAAQSAEEAAEASVQRLLNRPLVVYEKPNIVWILGEPHRIDRELAVPERREP